MEVNSDIVKLVEIDEAVLKDLEPLKLVFDHEETYSFESDESLKRSTVKNTPILPDFDAENVIELVEWLEIVERYVKIERLNSSCTLLVISDILNKKYFGKGLFKEKKLEFRNMLEIKVYLLRKIFEASDLTGLVRIGLYKPYKAETIAGVVNEFVQKCRAIALMSLSFGIKLGLSDSALMHSLLNRVPEDIIEAYCGEVQDIEYRNLPSLINFLARAGKGKVKIVPYENMFPIKRGIKQISEEQEKPPVIKCYCCGEIGHIKAKCPLKNERCNNCQKKGHIEKVCKAIAIRDKNNKLRGLATPKRKNFEFSIGIDETMRRLMNDFKAYVDKNLERMDKQQIKARERYYKKKMEKVAEEANKKLKELFEEDEEEKNPEKVNILQEESSDNEKKEQALQINWFMGRIEKVKEKEDMIYSVTINGTEIEAYFDTGAECCAMSKDIANKLKIPADPEIGEKLLIGPNGPFKANFSPKVEVKINETGEKIKVRFALLNCPLDRILLSLSVIHDLVGYQNTHLKF